MYVLITKKHKKLKNIKNKNSKEFPKKCYFAMDANRGQKKNKSEIVNTFQ